MNQINLWRLKPLSLFRLNICSAKRVSIRFVINTILFYRAYSEHITSVLVTASPGVRLRIQPTGRYLRGTLSPTANSLPLVVAPSPTGQAFLRAARNGDDLHLKELLRNATLTGISEKDLNAVDSSGRVSLKTD